MAEKNDNTIINESSYKKFVKDVGILGIAQLLIPLQAIILLPILTKVLGVSGYGVWIQAIITISLAETFASCGLISAMARFLPAQKRKSEIQEGFYSSLALVFSISLIFSFFMIVFSEYITNSLFDGYLHIVKLLALILPVTIGMRICTEYFRARHQIKKYSAIYVITTCGEVSLAAWMVFAGYGVFGAVLSILIVRGISFFITFFLVFLEIGIKLPNFSRLKEYMSYGLPTIPGGISTWIITSSDRYLIGYFLGVTYVGFYSPGYSIGFIIQAVPMVLSLALLPTLSNLYEEGKMTEVKNHLSYSLKYFLMLGIPFVFGASLLSKQILTILSTSEIATEGWLITPFTALSGLLFGCYLIISHILLLTKKTKITGSLGVLAAFVNLFLNFFFIPYIGILGAAITTLIAYGLIMIGGTYFSFREFRFSMESGFIFKSLIVSFIMASVIWVWNPMQMFDVISCIVVSIIIYFSILFLLKGFTMGEINFFKEFFISK